MVPLANVVPISDTIKNLISLQKENIRETDSLSYVVEDLSGINYLLQIQTGKIYFFCKNEASKEYISLILEILKFSESPEDFISRIFSRPVGKDLNENTQYTFLNNEWDNKILENLFSLLSKEGKIRYKKFLFPYLAGNVLFEREKQCRRLLPCWPKDHIVPFSNTLSMEKNDLGEMEINTHTFFYGNGWLKEKRTYDHIKNIFQRSHIQFLSFDDLKESASPVIDFSKTSAIYLSANAFKEVMEDWKKNVRGEGGTLHIIYFPNKIETIS